LLDVSLSNIIQGKYFDRIFIMQFENQGYSKTIRNKDFKSFADKGKILTNYFAITHPSEPNYIAQIGGDYFGIQDDSVHNLNNSNLVDLLEDNGISWKTYQEAYPGNCNPANTIGKYARKHNPFIIYDSIRNSPVRCNKIVNSKQLDTDLQNNNLPQFTYYTPDMNNDGHDTSLEYAGKFLTSYLESRLKLFPNGTLAVITFDEDDMKENNKIYTALIGSMIKPKSSDNTRYDHYSLLRTIENNWDLGTLKRNDDKAIPFKFN